MKVLVTEAVACRGKGKKAHNARSGFALLLAILLSAVLASAIVFVLARPALAAPKVSSTPDPTVQTNGQVRAVLAAGNRVYLGGTFTEVNGVTRKRLAAIDADTGQLTSWNPRAGAMVRALAASPDGSRIYAGGDFREVSNTPHSYAAAIYAASGQVDQSWNVNPDLSVHSIATLGGRVYLGGEFKAVNGLVRRNLAAVDGVTGTLDSGWTPSANGTVRSLVPARDGSSIYAGGHFEFINNLNRKKLANLDPVTGAPNGWAPNPCYPVYDIEVFGTTAYVAGGGAPLGCGAGGWGEAFDTGTGSRLWSHSSDGDFQGVTYLDGTVFFGGHFIEIPWVPAPAHGERWLRLAAVDPVTGQLDTQWRPEPNLGVWAMEVDPARKRLYVGGEFTAVNGQPRQAFAQFSTPPAPPPDTTVPVTTSTPSPGPNAAGWNNSDVTVTLSATDGESGSGVASITYSATGAQPIPGTTVAGDSAQVPITTEGTTTVSYFATDNEGNVEDEKNHTVLLDKTAPGVNCGAADEQWHANDVSISCTADDDLSGLAEAVDASFSLATSVAPGVESANAVTNSRQVFDAAGNPATAGPVGGNKVDKKGPEISLTSPPEGARYLRNEALVANYACSDGGSGVASCAGTVPSGGTVDTGSPGPGSFQVTATDVLGNTASVTHAYSVDECSIKGTEGDDVLEGTEGVDSICGLGGKDTLKGLGGNDTLKGEGSSDKLYGGAGDDVFDGGPGTDLVDFTLAPGAIVASLISNSATGEGSDTLVGVEHVTGSNFGDDLSGSTGADRLTGGKGSDTLVGREGADSLSGGANNDTINSVDGSVDNDTVDGGPAVDTCTTDATEASIVNCE